MASGSRLPPPVLQPKKRAKIVVQPSPPSSGFRVHWARIKRRIGTAGSLDNPSESANDETGDDSGTWRHTNGATNSDQPSSSHGWTNVGGTEAEPDEVDEIVVDNNFFGETDHGDSQTNYTASEKAPDFTSTSHHHTDKESTASTSLWDRYFLLTALRWRIVPFFAKFNSQAFLDPHAEAQYTRETWYSTKSLAILGGIWMIVNWVFACAMVVRPLHAFDKVFYFGLSPVLCVPLPFFVIFDFPRKRPLLYQTYTLVSVWSWSFFNIIYMNVCGFYGSHSYWSCGGRDWLGLLYYATALPAIGMFALQLQRVPYLIPPLIFIIVCAAIIAPYHGTFARSMVNIAVFHGFLLWIHYTREQSERRLYTLRDQVKLQYRATQKAQISERKASDSKRRLTSYIFHEVRVPLNTAMLALQNLEATLPQKDQEAGIELGALEASLSMMSKDKNFQTKHVVMHPDICFWGVVLLSDILDFNRMDAGRFESVSKAYSFHKAIRSSMIGLQMAADSKGLQLVTDFDRNIDLAARAAVYREQGKNEEWIAWQLASCPDEDAYMMGDEMRLIQVVTNLTSNACKFTSGPDGKVTVRTRLLYPSSPPSLLTGSTAVSSEKPESVRPSPQHEDSLPIEVEGLSARRLSRHNSHHGHHHKARPFRALTQSIVVRIEVHDTGVGIRPRDMIDNRLFSPYVQTEIGRHQGGKGTGLGLALVRHIVKLSGGRLGVQSKRDKGSCFWVEFPLGVVPNMIDAPESAKPIISPYPATPLIPIPNPFLQKYVPDDAAHTPGSEHTESSTPSKFLDLVGPPIPREFVDGDMELEDVRESLESPPTIQYTAPTPPSQPEATSPSTSKPRSPGLSSPSSPPTELPIPQLSVTASEAPESDFTTRPPRPVPVPSDPLPTRPSLIRMPSTPPFHPHAHSDPKPKRKSSDGASPTSPASSLDISTETVVALVVDDDQLTRKLMERMLHRIGCTVETAENGQRALELILQSSTSDPLSPSRNKFTIVFLDNQMPVLSGVEMVKKLRALGRTEFIVGITGNALKEDQVEYMEAGLDRVLTKPVLERSLKEMLQLALDRRRTAESPG